MSKFGQINCLFAQILDLFEQTRNVFVQISNLCGQIKHLFEQINEPAGWLSSRLAFVMKTNDLFERIKFFFEQMDDLFRQGLVLVLGVSVGVSALNHVYLYKYWFI